MVQQTKKESLSQPASLVTNLDLPNEWLPDQVRSAQLFVAGQTDSPEELAMFLDMLGIHSAQWPKNGARLSSR